MKQNRDLQEMMNDIVWAGRANKFGRAAAGRFAKQVKGCVECGGVALYRVGAKGYCKQHLAAARQRQKERNWQDNYSARVRGADELSSNIDDGEVEGE